MIGMAAGLEYTFGNVGNTGLDIGLLGEYIYDDRGDIALSSLQSDVFLATRFAFNDIQDTQILAGGAFDVNRSTRIFSVEASRRFGNSWRVELETRLFHNVSDREFVYVIRNDSFLQFSASKFF